MNKQSFKKVFEKVSKAVNLKVNNFDRYFTAFVHPSYSNENDCENYERLEFLGDAILDVLVAKYLYLNYPKMNEGQMTKVRATYVCASANAEYAKELCLDECVLLGHGEEEQGGASKQSVLGDIFESFLGAVFLDEGTDKVYEILEKYVFPKIASLEIEFFIDYKSRLQECIQAESRQGIKYVIEKESGPAHDKTFVASAYHEGLKLGTGTGKSKKEAEQAAAKDALEKLAK